ncbi:MFS general substrate transporter [Penicillium chermesinum]|nr:MFS general substrate transporter [Penicillium chermesinum]
MTFGYSFNIWVPLLIFPTAGPYGAPEWKKGWPVTFVFYFLLWAGFITAIVLHRREKRKTRTVAASDSDSNEEVEQVVVGQQSDAKPSKKI